MYVRGLKSFQNTRRDPQVFSRAPGQVTQGKTGQEMSSQRCTHACDQPTMSAEHLTPFSLTAGKAASHSAWSAGRKMSLPMAGGLELVDFEVSSTQTILWFTTGLCSAWRKRCAINWHVFLFQVPFSYTHSLSVFARSSSVSLLNTVVHWVPDLQVISGCHKVDVTRDLGHSLQKWIDIELMLDTGI